LRHQVKNVIIETPRYGAGGVMGMAAGPEHDLIGHGWVEIADGSLVVAIQSDGIVGHLEPKEKRRYELSQFTGWRVSGAHLEFSVGSIGGFATDGAQAPVHQGRCQFASQQEAEELTQEARANGMKPPSRPPQHSGL
jgi:hypothetical protein